MPNLTAACLISLTLLSTVGCSGGDDKFKQARPKTVIASGMVTYKGQPVDGATVVLAPVASDGVAASAISNAKGAFELMAFPPDSGAVPGSYKVTVTKIQIAPETAYSEDSHDALPTPAVKPSSVIPQKYSTANTSDLTADIPESGIETLSFDLKD